MTGREREGSDAQARGAGSDEAVERAWRDASDEVPSASLDAAILAAARSTVAANAGGETATGAGAVRASSRYTRWQPLAIAASVAGLALVLVQTLPRDPGPSSNSHGPAEVAATAPQDSAVMAAAPPAEVLPAPAVPGRKALESRAEPEAAPATTLPGTAEAKSSAADQVSAPAGLAAAAAMSRERSSAGAPADPQAWADRIAVLHAAGDFDAAAASLRAFRAAHDGADEFLPVALRAWAGSVE